MSCTFIEGEFGRLEGGGQDWWRLQGNLEMIARRGLMGVFYLNREEKRRRISLQSS